MVFAKSSEQELLDSQSHVLNHILTYINSMSLKCAIELGIPDAIHKHGKPMPLSQLVSAIPINAAKSDGLRRLMRMLVHSKFFDVKVEDEEGEEAYSLTGASRLLLRGDPLSMTPFALGIFGSAELWTHASEWFKDECSSTYETKHGVPFWEYVKGDEGSKLSTLFNEAMACDSGFVTTILSKEYSHVFEGLKTVVDVGGGTGATAKRILAAFPGLTCFVLDLPYVVAGLEGSHNLKYVSGDMFHSIPHADAVFLKWILHDWSDEECVKILKNCKEAITPSKDNGGKVVMVELVVEDRKEEHKATETQLLFDLEMLVTINGKERTEKEWAAIFVAAGFPNYKITPVLGLRSLIELFP